MLAIILTGAALIRERENGTLEHLLVMPVNSFEIMASKIWSMMLDDAGGADRDRAVADFRDPDFPGSSDRRFDSAFPVRRGAASVRRELAGDFPGVCFPEYAAAGHDADPGVSADADAFRRRYTPRKYASMSPVGHGNCADHAFRQFQPIHSLPRRRH